MAVHCCLCVHSAKFAANDEKNLFSLCQNLRNSLYTPLIIWLGGESAISTRPCRTKNAASILESMFLNHSKNLKSSPKFRINGNLQNAPGLRRSKLVDGVDDLSSNSLTMANQLEIRTLYVRSKLAHV